MQLLAGVCYGCGNCEECARAGAAGGEPRGEADERREANVSGVGFFQGKFGS